MFRDVARGVARNTSIMVFQQLLTWGSSFLLMMFLPRYLGPVEYGWLFLALSIMQIFQVIVSYGSNYLVVKSVARTPSSTGQILVDSVGFRTLFGAGSIVVIAAFMQLANFGGGVKVIVLIYSVALLWGGGISSLYSCFQGRELMEYTSAAAVAERAFDTIAVITAILLGANVMAIAILITLGSLIQFSVLAAFSGKIVSALPKISWGGTRRQIRDGVPYFLFAIFSVVYYRVDSLMLSKLASEAAVGLYGVSSRLFETMNFFPAIFSMAVYPALSRLWKEEERTHTRATQKSLEFMVLAGIPISIGLIVFAREIVQFFYGLPSYAASVQILQVLCIGLVVMYIDIILGTTLLSSDRQRQQSILALCAIPVKVGLNYILISYFQSTTGNGGIGAAAATILTEVGLMVSMLFLIPRAILIDFPLQPLAKALVAAVFMVGLIVITQYAGLHWVAAAAVGSGVYIGALLVMKTLEPSEEEFFCSLVRVANLKKVVGIGGLGREG